jgi:L-amino acid N-acyltransferase YncA
MEVRDAVSSDLPAIVAIYNTTIASRMVTADLNPVTVEERRHWFEQHSPSRRPVWVATEGDRVIGWLSYSSFHPRAAYDATCELSLYLAPEHRGRGLGSQLLQRSIAQAPAFGIRNLVGLIFGHNTPSLRLFARHGFDRWGQLLRVAVLDGVERDLVIVGRRV